MPFIEPMSPPDRPSGILPIPRRVDRLALERRATRELAAYFASVRGKRPPCENTAAVEATLAAVGGYRLGVLRLYHDARVWPAAVTKRFGKLASIAVRLDCADHPAEGSTPALEAAAAERLAAMASGDGATYALAELEHRAGRHYRRALRGYTKALAGKEALVIVRPGRRLRRAA